MSKKVLFKQNQQYFNLGTEEKKHEKTEWIQMKFLWTITKRKDKIELGIKLSQYK